MIRPPTCPGNRNRYSVAFHVRHYVEQEALGCPRIEEREYVLDLLHDLAERGGIRLIEQPPTGGRPASPIIELHPQLQGTAV